MFRNYSMIVCDCRWNTLPKNKKELIDFYNRNMTTQWPTTYYVIVIKP